MTDPMFRPTPNGVVAVVELSERDLDILLENLNWNSDLALRLQQAATMIRKMEALT